MSVVLGLVLAVLVAGLFALAMIESSLLRVRRSAVAAHAQPGDRQGTQLLRLLDDPPSVMNAVLLAVLTLQVTAASIAGILAPRWFGGVGVTIATVVITFVLFVCGETQPTTQHVRQAVSTGASTLAIDVVGHLASDEVVELAAIDLDTGMK